MTANLLQANLLQATPFMHVRDLEATLAFFAQLGFRVGHRESNYAYVHREGAAVRILEEKDARLGLAASAIISTVATSTPFTASSSPGSTRCRRATSTVPPTSPIDSVSC